MIGLEARATAAAEHGHDPRRLWPDLDVAGWPRAILELVAVARAVIAGGAAVTLDESVATPVTFGRAAFRLGIGPLMGHWIAAGQVTASVAAGRMFAAHFDHSRRRAARLTEEAATVVREMTDAGVAPVLLKGPDSATFYPAPGARTFGDIDLFVTPAEAPRAEAVLRRLGFSPGRLREGRRRDWVAPATQLASLELAHTDNPWGVDLHLGLGRMFHWALVAELPDPEPEACGSLDLGGIKVATLPPALRLANLALHASASLRLLQLQHLLDVVFAARAAPAATWPELCALLDDAGSSRFIYPALVLVERLAPGAIPADALHAVGARTHLRLRRIAEQLPLTGLSRPDRWNLIYAFMWARTTREALTVVWRQVLPHRHRTAREQLQFQQKLLLRLIKGQLRYGLPSE